MAEKTSVLIVDDDEMMCKTLADVLSKKGYDCLAVESGLKAAEKLRQRPFDVVLMDIKMPVMDGVATYKELKKLRPETKVIMMTAFSLEELIKEALKEGAYGVVKKPLDIDQIVNMIGRHIQDGALLMVVDDDPQICKTMKDILEKKGFPTSTAASGEEAIQIAKQRPQDILFIDMKLPALNGLETYLGIKKINPKVIAIMMTAYRYEFQDLLQIAIKNGAYACFYKPFDMQEVLKLVEEIEKIKKG